jgi:hypothetical protein
LDLEFQATLGNIAKLCLKKLIGRDRERERERERERRRRTETERERHMK